MGFILFCIGVFLFIRAFIQFSGVKDVDFSKMRF